MLQIASDLHDLDVLKTHHREVEILWYGIGHCPGHFGELVQGVFTTGRETPVRGLITLPCRKIGTVAWVKVIDGSGAIFLPDGKVKVQRAIEAFKALYGIPSEVDISVELESTIPVGIGMGSSTSDIVATIRALDQAFGIHTDGQALTKLTLAAEAACDSTMLFGTAKIFAQRDGFIIEDFGRPLPCLAIYGFDLIPGEQFRTDETPPAEYDADDIRCFDDLRGQLRDALQSESTARVADVATASALINEKFYPKRNFAELMELRRTSNALGVCISHSGTIAGLIYAAGGVPRAADLQKLRAAALEIGIRPLGVFRI